MRNLTKDEVEFTVSLEIEDLQVRGNYICSDDPAYDKEAEDEIIDRLNRDDTSAWCCLTIKAEWEDFKGFAYLGGCSFSEGKSGSELAKEAEEMAEEHGMYEEALEDLNTNIALSIGRAELIKARLTE
jgi:hypothetical protein